MRIVVIGANGQLGTDISKFFADNGHEVVPLTHAQLDISDAEQVGKVIGESSANIVVNTAAMHNMDACEQDPARSFAVNGIGARNLAFACNETDATLMHISTDYVFDGLKQKPYFESDCPRPLNVYGNTKLAGEYFIQTISKKFFIFRVSAIYGENPCRAKGGLNFIGLMLKLAQEREEIRVVDNEIVSPTSTRDIARQVEHMTHSDAYGLYHCTSQGECSWYAFAEKIFELTDTKINLAVADPAEFPIKVPRPFYSVLENKGLQGIDLDIMPHWHEALEEFLASS